MWLALYFPQLPLEVFTRGQGVGGPAAVSEVRQGRNRILRCNGPAAACGVRPGLSVTAALALRGDLTLFQREPEREQAALHGLAAWAYQFSDQPSIEPGGLVLEIGASKRLFGGVARIVQLVERDLNRLGYRVQRGAAPTPTGAMLLARARQGEQAADPIELRRLVADIPIEWLLRDRQARELVRGIGLATIGDCLDLPHAELSRRAGPLLGKALDRLLGREPDPRPAWEPPPSFSERIELPAEITHGQALLFPARRLLVGLCGYLRGRGAGAQQLRWRVLHRDGGASEFQQGLLNPSRDPDHMVELLRERLERWRLPRPALALELRVGDLLNFEEASDDLFGGQGRQVGEALLERLRSRLGEQAVQGLAVAEDHRPERAWQYQPALSNRSPSTLTQAAQGERPLWLLEQPRPLRERGRVPEYGGPLRLVEPPERIESGWWDGGDVARDYYLALSQAGERLWVYQDRRGGGWFLHGLFD